MTLQNSKGTDSGWLKKKRSKSESTLNLPFLHSSISKKLEKVSKVLPSLVLPWRYQISAMPLDTGKLYVKFMNDKAGSCGGSGGSVENGEITPQIVMSSLGK